MIVDARREGVTALDTDVCIAGAGPAGIVLARELAASGRDVVLLEAGGRDESDEQQAYFDGDVTGLRYDLRNTRYRVLGGATLHWSGYCAPLDGTDFEAHPWIPLSGWPFDRNALEPFYRRADATLRFGDEGYAPATWDTDDAPLIDFPAGTLRNKIWRFHRLRFGTAFESELAASDRIRLLLHAPLVRVRSNEARDRIEGFEIEPEAGRRVPVRARHFVLACGGIENARLLLAAGPDHGPVIDNDNVGRFFMEHFHLYFSLKMTLFGAAARSASYQNYTGAFGEVRSFFQIDEEVRQREGLTNVAFKMANDVSVDAAGRASASLAGVPDDAVRSMRVSMMGEQVPNPASRVTLADETDPLGMPRVRLDWRATSLDVASMHRSARLFAEGIARARAGRVRVKDVVADLALRSEFGEDVAWGAHHMGTTRIADSPSNGVVDRHARVHGVTNLHVAGSSVFPTSGIANPTLTLLALTHRLADRLRAIDR